MGGCPCSESALCGFVVYFRCSCWPLQIVCIGFVCFKGMKQKALDCLLPCADSVPGGCSEFLVTGQTEQGFARSGLGFFSPLSSRVLCSPDLQDFS